MNTVNQLKDKIQHQALEVIENDLHHRACIYMATGTGKSRVPLLYIQKYDLTDICLLVPTTKLKNEDWPAEFKKWGCEKYLNHTTRVCLKSCHKIKGKTFRLLIVDEGHNIKENFFEFLRNNTIGAVIFMTATKPTQGEKFFLIQRLGIKSEFIVTLKQAKELGLVAPYKINIIYTALDSVNKTVKIENKNKSFYVTEQVAYDSICKQYELAVSGMGGSSMVAVNRRMHFLYKLESKKVAVKIVSELLPKDSKVLIFMGNSEAADYVSEHSYHSNLTPTQRSENFTLFNTGKINRLSCCKSLNEGTNINKIDVGLIGQINSKEKDFLQRLGRILRLREGHQGVMYIVVVKNTQDEVWVKKALTSFEDSEITEYTIDKFVEKYGNKPESEGSCKFF